MEIYSKLTVPASLQPQACQIELEIWPEHTQNSSPVLLTLPDEFCLAAGFITRGFLKVWEVALSHLSNSNYFNVSWLLDRTHTLGTVQENRNFVSSQHENALDFSQKWVLCKIFLRLNETLCSVQNKMFCFMRGSFCSCKMNVGQSYLANLVSEDDRITSLTFSNLIMGGEVGRCVWNFNKFDFICK